VTECRRSLEDDARRLWIGTAAGLALFDRHADRFDTYRHEAADPRESAGRLCHFPCMRTAPACCGSAQRPRAWQSGIHVHGLSGISWALTLRGTAITAFAEDSKGTLWLGTFGAGLSAIDRRTGTARPYRHQPSDAHSLPG